MRIGQKVMNDILKEFKIRIDWIEAKHSFVTSVSCGKLFNMTDEEFKKKYLNNKDDYRHCSGNPHDI